MALEPATAAEHPGLGAADQQKEHHTAMLPVLPDNSPQPLTHLQRFRAPRVPPLVSLRVARVQAPVVRARERAVRPQPPALRVQQAYRRVERRPVRGTAERALGRGGKMGTTAFPITRVLKTVGTDSTTLYSIKRSLEDAQRSYVFEPS